MYLEMNMGLKLSQIIARNHQWAKTAESDFEALAQAQSPKVFWLSCVDSRVAPDQICAASPGDFFVHRNIANQAPPNDSSLWATLRYAVDILAVELIVVCGHSHCGGVQAALNPEPLPDIEEWITPLRQLAQSHQAQLSALNAEQGVDFLVRQNITSQVKAIEQAPAVQQAKARGQELTLCGLYYDLESGQLHPIC